jgi:peptidyl-prolyl cis-trans isomerase B (cyclophilin B)
MSTPSTPQQPGTPQGATQPTAPLPQTAQQPAYTAPQGGQPAYSGPSQPYQQPAQQPAQPGYPQQTAPQYRPQSAPAPSTATTLGQTNTYALLAIVFAFLVPLAGIIFGHLGLGQIKRTGDAGRGIALTGLIISYAYFVFLAMFIIIYVGFIFAMIGAIGSLGSGYSSF